ncbi:MAG: DUF294 nucleotidyltransferase-like domain-containing protein [Pseudomonadota bacterium]
MARAIEVRYFRKGSDIIIAGQSNDKLSIVRSGAVELRLDGDMMHARLGEGECYGYPSLLAEGITRNAVQALEDSLIYQVDGDCFLTLHAAHPPLQRYCIADSQLRLKRALRTLREDNGGAEISPHSQARMGDLISRDRLVTAQAAMSVFDAAQMMTRENVTTLPIFDDKALVGIVSDSDLRARVLAAGRDPDTLLSEVMTPDPITASSQDPLLGALLTLMDRHIHHLPVTDPNGELIGIVGASDILGRLGADALHIAGEVRLARNAHDVAQAAARLPACFASLVEAGVDAEHVARFTSSIGETAHRQLLQLAEEKLGPPPVPYALVAFGSLARNEQSLGSDQDNGFVFGDGYDPAQHDEYFSAVAQLLCDGLHEAGYVYCPGNIMATNSAWRHDVAGWEAIFNGWIDAPDPDAVMRSGIFFDMRALAGDVALVDGLRRRVFARAAENRIFLSFVARAAAATKIPLGFFRNFLLKDDAVHGRVLDLKAQAINPVIDLVRCHALAERLEAVNTHARMAALRERQGFESAIVANVSDAFDFIREVRIRHQARQVGAGKTPDNKLDPQNLSQFEQTHLKDAFKLIRDRLDALRSRYAGSIT